jgi:nicotinate-nucleotide adenylyltransferase
MTRRLGILGGTFDPIHRGHLDLVAAAEAALALTEIAVIPLNVPPHRPAPVASSFHRFAMAAIAVAGRAGWQVSDLELTEPGPSYTTETLRRLHARGYRASELFFLIGADAFTDIGLWKDYPGILERANFAVVSRPGWPVAQLPDTLPVLAPRMRSPQEPSTSDTSIILIEADTADVSATATRQRCAEGRSITGMVTDGVRQHIEQHALYAPSASNRRELDTSIIPAAGRLHGES